MFYHLTDEVRADNLVRLVHDGFRAQIMMSVDRFCARLGKFSFPATAEHIYLKSQGLYQAHTYMFTDFIPMLRTRGVSQADIDSILEDNPRRFFAGDNMTA